MKKSQLSLVIPSSMEWFSLSSYMAIDNDSLLSLQIISQEGHPNMHFTNARCGISLFSNQPLVRELEFDGIGLMNKCKSAPGKHLFRYWLLRPLKVQCLIEQRQAAVEWMIEHIVSRGYLQDIQNLLRGINRVVQIFGNLSGQCHHQGFKDLLKVPFRIHPH